MRLALTQQTDTMSYYENEKLDREHLLSKESALVEPVTQPRPKIKRSTRFRGLLITILALSSLYYLTHLTFRGHGHDVKFKGECAMKHADASWAFSALKSPEAKLPLRGKAAEELFLSVTPLTDQRTRSDKLCPVLYPTRPAPYKHRVYMRPSRILPVRTVTFRPRRTSSHSCRRNSVSSQLLTSRFSLPALSPLARLPSASPT